VGKWWVGDKDLYSHSLITSIGVGFESGGGTRREQGYVWRISRVWGVFSGLDEEITNSNKIGQIGKL
jgi:hypothetical protein